MARTLSIFTLSFLAIVFAAEVEVAVHAQRPSAKLQLIETGEFHGFEISARTGERWLGLFETKTGFKLLPTTLFVTKVRDELLDKKAKDKTGKKVAVNEGEALFLIRGDKSLLKSKVVTIFRDKQVIGNNQVLKFRLGCVDYRLEVRSNSPERVDYLMPNSKLLLISQNSTQLLTSSASPLDANWYVLWAGDIDGDGKLDLYMDITDHYNMSVRTLFLSSRAKPGRLMKIAATFTTVGC